MSVTWIPTPTVTTQKNGHPPHSSSQDLEEAIWKTEIDHLNMLVSNPSRIEAFNSLYEQLAKKRPFSDELDTIMLDHLEAGKTTSNSTSLILHLEKMLSKIDTQSIRDHFSMRRHLKTAKEKERNNDMKQLRDLYLELLHRKAKALALQESHSGETTPSFELAVDEMRTWIDTSEGDYRDLEVWEDQREKSFGKALEHLNALIEADESNKSLLEKRLALLDSNHWPYWREQYEQLMLERFPKTNVK